MGAYPQRLTMAAYLTETCVTIDLYGLQLLMTHGRCLWQASPMLAQCPLLNLVPPINYGQDEIRVPSDSPSFPAPRETQHGETFAAFFYVPLRTTARDAKEKTRTKVNCLTDVKKHWIIIKNKSARKESAKSRRDEGRLAGLSIAPHQLPPGCYDNILSWAWCLSAPPGGSWEIG